jgi:glycerophosphoryl diester phosphodiesterase
MTKPLVIGHRGSPEVFPENTLQSFESAIQEGADMFELDLQESSDGHLVIIHDFEVDRVSNQEGLVASMNLDELKALDLGNGAVIPTLEEVLDLAKGRIKVNIEIKVPNIEDSALEAVTTKGMLNDVIFSSFIPDILTDIKNQNDAATTAILYSQPIVDPVSYAIELRTSAINPLFFLLEPKIVEEAHQSLLNVFPWTVNDEQMIEELVKMNVDGIITDHPKLGREIVDRLTE